MCPKVTRFQQKSWKQDFVSVWHQRERRSRVQWSGMVTALKSKDERAAVLASHVSNCWGGGVREGWGKYNRTVLKWEARMRIAEVWKGEKKTDMATRRLVSEGFRRCWEDSITIMYRRESWHWCWGQEMGVTVLDDSCGGAVEINILLVSNQYFSPHSQLTVEEKKKTSRKKLWCLLNMGHYEWMYRVKEWVHMGA